MARKSLKCPPTVEPNQFGCVWKFSGMFDHHHHHSRPHQNLLSDRSHGNKSIPGASQARSQVRMLTFDEQLRNINIESEKKSTSVNQSLKGETSSSNDTRKNNQVLKNTVEKSFWKRIKSLYENPIKKENPVYNTIMVLKPGQRVIDCPVDVGCGCSYLHSHQSSTSKQQIVKHTRVSFDDVRKKLKNKKKLKSIRKERSCEPSKGGEINKIPPKAEKLSLVPFSKKREPDVFMEARRHLAERLMQISKGEGEASSSKRASRTLERVLLSSPKHKSMEITLDVSSPKGDCKLENMDNDQYRENPSPVSVLDSFFADNIGSPTSTIESAVELQIQPRRLEFEEHSSQTSSPPYQKTSPSLFMEDREFISTYINQIYQTSESNWEDFLSTDYPLESSCDHKLLYDCVKEVLIGLNLRVTFVSSKIRPFSLEKDVVNEVMERVDWHNGQPMIPRTLDNLARRDIAKDGEWVDLLDRNDVVFEVVDETLQVLIMEAIFDICV